MTFIKTLFFNITVFYAPVNIMDIADTSWDKSKLLITYPCAPVCVVSNSRYCRMISHIQGGNICRVSPQCGPSGGPSNYLQVQHDQFMLNHGCRILYCTSVHACTVFSFIVIISIVLYKNRKRTQHAFFIFAIRKTITNKQSSSC